MFRAADARARILASQVTANARVAAEQLAKLKRWWKIEGLSEHDIHQLIPDRPERRGGPADDEDGGLVELGPAEEDGALAAR